MRRLFARSVVLTLTLLALTLLPGPRATWAAPAEPAEQAAKSKKPPSEKSKKAPAESSKKKPDTAEEKKAETEKPDAEKKPAEEKAEGDAEKPDSKSVELSGVFEARNTTEIALRPQAWSTLKVLSAVPHGKRVQRGQVLLVLDLEPIDTAIADLRAAHQLSDLAMRQAEIDLAALKAKTTLSQESTERAHRIAREDFQQYTKVKRPRSLKSAEFGLLSAKRRLEYQEEELRQLEEMYKADDLTEETEEIVLKRARNALESARYMYEGSKMNHAATLKFEIPRLDEQMKQAAAQAEIAWQTARHAPQLALKKLELETAKMKIDRKRSEEKLDKLLADRATMVVKSPVDGVVYYGPCEGGKVSSSATIAKKLRLGGAITANEVVMTIVQPRPMLVRSTLAEKDLAKVGVGDRCKVIPTGYPDVELSGVVSDVSAVPVESGKFDIRITLVGDGGTSLVPGMTCKAKFAAPEEKEGQSGDGKKEEKKEQKGTAKKG